MARNTKTTAQPKLPNFEGNDVALAAVSIRKAGDGLSDALRVAPVPLQIGESVYYVLEGVVSGVQHRTDRDGILSRIHIVDTERISPIDSEQAEKVLQAFAEETERRKAEVDGQTRMDDEYGAGADTNTAAGD